MMSLRRNMHIPTHGKRKQGRPRMLYLQYIQHLLGDTEGLFQPNNIALLAQDRSSWRKLVSPALQPNDDDDDQILHLH